MNLSTRHCGSVCVAVRIYAWKFTPREGLASIPKNDHDGELSENMDDTCSESTVLSPCGVFGAASARTISHCPFGGVMCKGNKSGDLVLVAHHP